MKNKLQEILSIFPKHPYAFAYGSAVFRQTYNSSKSKDNLSKNDKNKMIDFIIVVDNSSVWHQNNMKKNSSHYSFLKYLGSQTISKIQENFAANCYYNTLIPYKDNFIKYGVIQKNHFINDLLDWDHLYISGRLHKPVETISYNHTSESDLKRLDTIIKINYQSAIHSCLLQLPEVFNDEDFFSVLTSLSYEGDFRMIFGEDKNKIKNIVTAQLPLFKEIYKPYLNELVESNILQYNNSKNVYIRDLNPRSILHSLNLLPKRVQQKLYIEFNKTGKLFDIDDVLLALSHSYEYQNYLKKSLKQIVQKSSITQSFKGLLSAGLLKSSKYSLSKLLKMKKSLKS